MNWIVWVGYGFAAVVMAAIDEFTAGAILLAALLISEAIND